METSETLALGAPEEPRREKLIVALVGAIQFVNILDFMMVMPLGPDLARALAIDPSKLGYIGGSYTAAASVSGLLGALVLDRFDRRRALGVAMAGLVTATALGGIATSFSTLILARLLAGAFGGPATSLSVSIIADVIPESRRGRAMGAVAMAFSLASILGVPAGLELARRGGWPMPFFVTAGAGLVVTAAAIALLPPLRGHLERKIKTGNTPSLQDVFWGPGVLLSYAMTAVAMFGSFVLIPNISAYLQDNLGYPREKLGLLYMGGGIVSLLAMRVAGRSVDHFGSARVVTASTVLLVSAAWLGYANEPPLIPVVGVFILFMLAMSVRNVAMQTLTSKVPSPSARARFMSLQSMIQHLCSALGAFASAHLLTERFGRDPSHAPPGHEHALEGMKSVAFVTIAASIALPFVMAVVESGVKKRARAVVTTA